MFYTKILAIILNLLIGYEINAQTANDGCGNLAVQLNSQTQSVKFPIDDQPFSTKTNCIVKISPPAGFVTTTSIETMEIDDPNTNCNQGYFQVAATTDALNGAPKRCGKDPVKDILKDSEAVYVQIKMDGMLKPAKFALNFVSTKIPGPNDGCGNLTVQLNSNTQSVTFPLDDQPFTAKTNCRVKISPPAGSVTTTSIESMEIEDPNKNCNQGYFQVAATTDALDGAPKRCGKDAVADILKASETVYVQIKMDGMLKPAKFTLKFVSSVSRMMASSLLATLCLLCQHLINL